VRSHCHGHTCIVESGKVSKSNNIKYNMTQTICSFVFKYNKVRLQKKCEQYYGEEKGNIVLHGQFSIETTDVEHYADFVIRTLQVTKAVRGEDFMEVGYQSHLFGMVQNCHVSVSVEYDWLQPVYREHGDA
jgi:hypothetical protein